MKSVAEYLSLYEPSPVLGAEGIERVKQPLYFLGVVAGASSLVVYDQIRQGAPLQWGSFITALIMSVLTFPYIYENAGLESAKMSFAKWCLAFQYGFFWPVLFERIREGV